jgi:hypothetical protein
MQPTRNYYKSICRSLFALAQPYARGKVAALDRAEGSELRRINLAVHHTGVGVVGYIVEAALQCPLCRLEAGKSRQECRRNCNVRKTCLAMHGYSRGSFQRYPRPRTDTPFHQLPRLQKIAPEWRFVRPLLRQRRASQKEMRRCACALVICLLQQANGESYRKPTNDRSP